MLTKKALILTALLASCGHDASKTQGTGTDTGGTVAAGAGGAGASSLPADVPSDSTGASATMALAFGTVQPAAALGLTAASTLDVGSGVVLAKAEINIAAVRVKAAGDESDEEKAERKTRESEEASDKADDDAAKAQEKTLEDQYKVKIDAAATQADKDALKAEFETKRQALRQQLAQAKAAADQAKLDGEASHDGNLRWKGPFVFDAVVGSTSPALPTVDLADGSYRRIEFELKRNRTADPSDQVLDNVLYLSGTLTVGSTQHPFTLSYHGSENIRMKGTSAVKALASTSNAVAIVFDPKAWFAGLDLSKATVADDGSVTIDEDTNKDLLQGVVKALKHSTGFGKDQHGDGKLTAGDEAGTGDAAATEDEKEATNQ